MSRKRIGGFFSAAVATVAIAGSTLVGAPTASAQPAVCPDVLVVGIEGTGSVGAPPPTIIKNIVEPYRSKPGHEVVYLDDANVYPGSIWPVGPYPYDQSREAGTQYGINVIEAKHAECPDTEFKTIGHSQGAVVAGDILQRLHEKGSVPDDQLSGEGYADGRQAVTGIEVVLPGIVPGYTMRNERTNMGEIEWYSECRATDPICDFPQPLQEPVRVFTAPGDFMERHGQYYPNGTEDKAGYVVTPSPPSNLNGTPVPAPMPGPTLPDVAVPPLAPVPPLPNLNSKYVPTPVKNYLPPEVQAVLPREVNEFIPPPLF